MTSDKKSIESAYKELQKIVSEFENDEINLETSLPKFKKGLELSAFLKDRLGELKNEIKEIKDKFADN
ncbi:MAG: exodeoxyribonuclease VII small subunit [bacterium]